MSTETPVNRFQTNSSPFHTLLCKLLVVSAELDAHTAQRLVVQGCVRSSVCPGSVSVLVLLSGFTPSSLLVEILIS